MWCIYADWNVISSGCGSLGSKATETSGALRTDVLAQRPAPAVQAVAGIRELGDSCRLVAGEQHDGEQRTQDHNQPDNLSLTAVGFLFHHTAYSVSTSMRRCNAVSTSFRSAATPPTLLIRALKVRAS